MVYVHTVRKEVIFLYSLDFTSKIPIYQQIVDQTKDLIIKGYLKEGDKMPSVREMVNLLLVNQSTVSRAYRELEVLGVISSVPGKGSYILLDEKKIELQKEQFEEKLAEVFREAKFLGYEVDEIIKIFNNQGGQNEIKS